MATTAPLQARTQAFDPWGKVRSGGISQTSLNYTGQRLDGTGLLYYHARYYDPVLGRFISADSVVPGDASGGMEGVALTPLTVDFHAVGFVARLNEEHQFGWWFQLADAEQERLGRPWGPANPQALNRYAYVQNNPLRYTDPTGHSDCSVVDTSPGGVCTIGGGGGGGEPPGPGGSGQAPATSAKAEAAARGGAGVGDASTAARLVARYGDEAGQAAQGGDITLYRAVSHEEYLDLESTNAFRPVSSSVEGKYFAEQLEHAQQWGDLLMGSGQYRVVRANAGVDVPHTRWQKLDGIGPARFYDADQLHRIRYGGAVPQ